MQIYHIATTISHDGTLTITKLPFRAGEEIQVTVRRREDKQKRDKRYSLRGKPVRYENPFGSVAEGDWNVLQ